ncbi:hypothetical protein V5799_011814 [Amblyomma americanum]|uniref:Uncharacterized protein n=1 Tax=Amblyomma americanum TaxID=6943 RepID=A0AAQ4EG33_AMBAM
MTSKCLVTFRERNFVLPFDGTLTQRGLVERVRDHELFRGIDVATLIFTMFEEDFNVFVDIPEDFEIRDREKISLRGLPGSDCGCSRRAPASGAIPATKVDSTSKHAAELSNGSIMTSAYTPCTLASCTMRLRKLWCPGTQTWLTHLAPAMQLHQTGRMRRVLLATSKE